MKTYVTVLIVILTFGISDGVGQTISHNLIQNSYMDVLSGAQPWGYETYGGTLTIESVHPFTKGFEGPYEANAPSNAVSSVDAATEQNPYWFGRNDKGPRANRGGLADGWHSYQGGHILKITGDNSAIHAAVFFPFERNVLTNKVRLRAWIKITSGESVSFGGDAGYKLRERGFTLTKQTADQAQDGWYRVDEIIDISEVTSLDAWSFSMGLKGQNIEVYLALPHLSIVDNDSWMPSISDYLLRNGFNFSGTQGVYFDQNVGIGTTKPDEKLTVAGTGKFEEVIVEEDTGADFVFQDDYNLPDLSKLEAFIRANKHLPEIPTAAQMKAEGVKVGDLQMKLLQKIEELTLYVIDQQKEINQRQKVEDRLENKVTKQEKLIKELLYRIKKLESQN